MPDPESYDVFLSHVSEDAELARSLASALRTDRLRVFLAEDTISAGENWYRTIEDALGNAAVAVVLFGPRAQTSKWMAAEWMAAAMGAMSGQSLLVPVPVGKHRRQRAASDASAIPGNSPRHACRVSRRWRK